MDIINGRRRFLAAIGAATLALAALAGAGGEANAQTKIRVGIQSVPPDELMKAKNWFSKYGVEIELTQFSSGGDMMQAFVAGRVDIANGGSARLVTLAANQPELFKIISAHQYGGDRYGLLVTPESSAKSLADLKGKKIGMVPGSGASEAFALYLQKNGLTESDFQLVNMKVQDIRSAVQQKLIDGGLAWEPHVAIAETGGTAKRIASMEGITESPNFYLVNRKFADANPQAVAQFLAGLIDVSNAISASPKEMGALAAASIGQKGVSVPKEALELAFTRIKVGKKVDNELLSELAPIAESMKAANRIAAVPDFTKLVDSSYYEAAQKLTQQPKS